MNKLTAISELEPPQPLHRPVPRNHFPSPTPRVSTNSGTSISTPHLFIDENWN